MQLRGFQPPAACPRGVSAGLGSLSHPGHTEQLPSDAWGDLRITFQPGYLWDKFSLIHLCLSMKRISDKARTFPLV